MNYYVKINNNQYNVIDGNTNRVVATFMSEIDAHKFLQSLYEDMFKRNTYGFQQNYGPMPVPTIQPYVQPYPMANPYMNQPFIGQGQYINQNPYMNQPNLNQQPQVNLNPLNNLAGQGFSTQSETLNQLSNVSTQENISTQIKEKLNVENKEDDNIDLIKFNPRDKVEFNDNNLTIDPLIFLEDKKGAIIKQDKKKEINNTDDDSLGEVSIFAKNNNESDIESEKVLSEDEITKTKVDNEKKINDKATIIEEDDKAEFVDWNIDQPINEPTFDFIKQPQIQQPLNFKNNQNLNKTQTLNQIYSENKIEEFKISDPNVIDLGPIEEDDTIFSTPRNDAKEEEKEIVFLTKKERKELRNLQKREAANKKRYEKMLS